MQHKGNFKIPKKLKAGMTVAFIAPSGPVTDTIKLENSVKAIESLGLRVKVFDSCCKEHGYLAGTDDIRTHDINTAFSDDSIDGILCIRGGYGAQRTLSGLDYDMISNNPKVFAGYSDVTALHLAFNQRCGFVTYHTPMPYTELSRSDIDDYTIKSYVDNLFGIEKPTFENFNNVRLKALYPGSCKGIITGGNLSLLASSLGTPYEVDTKDKILFIEEIEETPYAIDRMLLSLKLSGKLSDCAGIVFGAFTDCVPKMGQPSLTIEQLIYELVIPEKKPTLWGLMCGHCLPTLSLPLGGNFRMNCDLETLELNDRAFGEQTV